MSKAAKVKPEPIDIGDRVEVRWFDAHGGGGWMPPEEIKRIPHEIVSIGGVLDNNEHALTIVQSADITSGGVDNYLLIPWVNVTRVTIF